MKPSAPDPPVSPGQPGAPTQQASTIGGSPDPDLRGAIAAFSEVAAALNADMDLDDLLHLVCNKVCGLVGVERASLYLKDRASGLYRGQVARQDVYDAQVKSYVAGGPADAFTREILATKRPVLVANAQTDPRPVRAQMRRWSVRSMLGVPMIESDEVRGLVFLDNGPIEHVYTEAQQAIAQTFANLAATAVSQSTASAALKHNMETVARQNKLLKRSTLINDRLTDLVLAGAGVREIAQLTADLAGYPCIVHDAQFGRIAEAGFAPTEEVRSSVLDERFRRQDRLAAAFEQLGRRRTITFEPSAGIGLDRRFLVSTALVHGVPWGYVVLQERRTRFGPLDTLIAQRAAGIIALELVVAQRGVESELDSRRALLAELIREQTDVAPLERRAERLRADLSQPHIVVVVGVRDPKAQAPPTVRRLTEAIADAGASPSVLAAEVAEDLVLAVQLPGGELAADEATVRAALEHACQRLVGANELLVGISSSCHGAEEFTRAYFEAAQIVSALREHAPVRNGRVLVVGNTDLGPARMLLASHSARRLDEFLEGTFGRLLEADDPAHGVLLETLDAYFGSTQSTGRTADALDIHKNTVRNRLARIEELAPIAVVSDPDAQVRAQMAIRVLTLRRRFTADPSPPAVGPSQAST